MSLITRRRLLGVPFALSAVSLAACGGGNDDENTGHSNVRLLNLMSDLASIDLWADDTRWFAGAATDAVTDYIDVDDDTFDLELRSAGSSSTLLSNEQGFGEDLYYTLIAWGRAGAPRIWKLEENQDVDDIASGRGALRVFGATEDIGLLDVYLTAETTDLADATAQFSGIGEGNASGYAEISAGTYRLRVTGNGDPDDLRLDLSGIAVTAATYSTLVLTAGSGGTLVHASLLAQRGALNTQRNTKARLRFVAGVAGNPVVGASWGGSTIAGALTAPVVGPYALVNAGTQALELRVNGTTVLSETRTLMAGADATLVALGTVAAPSLAWVSDDNRLPSTSTRAKVRLVHGDATLNALTLSIDYGVMSSDVAVGSASSFASLTANDSARIDVTAANSSAAVYSATDVNLQAQGVYTLFVLGGHSTPTGVLRKDR
jgi:hypothetical protein